MANLDTVYFQQRAAELTLRADQLNVEYNKHSPMPWLALNPFYNAVLNAARAAQSLAGLAGDTSVEPTASLVADAAAEIEAIKRMIASVDIDKAKSDETYAGGLLVMASKVAQLSGVAVLALSTAVASLLKAREQCVLARDGRDALTDPSRPRHKYAIVKESIVHQAGGRPFTFNKGKHCQIHWEGPDGCIRVESCGYSVFLTRVQVAQYFEVVEL